MKRAGAWAALVLTAGLATGFAQPREAPAKEAESSPSGSLEIWKWANFLLLAGGIGFLVRKHAGPFFAARSREIRKELVEAEETRKDAEGRVAAIEARLAGLGAAMEALKQEALAEQEAEGERFRRQNAADLAKIQAHAGQEIEAAGKQARLELKRHTASMALTLAEQKVRARMTPQAQGALVDSFVRNLAHPNSRAEAM
jgi:F0F1-type ATP synthase membrane subunit b/b'